MHNESLGLLHSDKINVLIRRTLILSKSRSNRSLIKLQSNVLKGGRNRLPVFGKLFATILKQWNDMLLSLIYH